MSDEYLIDQVDNGDGTITNYYSDSSSEVIDAPTSGGDTGDTGGGDTGNTGAADPVRGNKVITYDDGSTMTVDANGNPVSATNTKGEVVTTTDANGKVTVTAAGKDNPSFFGAASNYFNKAVDKLTTTNGLRSLLTTTDANGRTVINPAAAGIGAIIGMLNRRTGEEGTRGLKDAVAAKPTSRQQIVNPVGAATGQGQNYFTPMSYADVAPTQKVTTTGGGIAGLNPEKATPANYVNPTAMPVTSASGNAGTQIPASTDAINNLMSMYNQYNPQPTQAPVKAAVKAAVGGMMDGGISNLGSYTHAAGGRMLKGPGDGMSDDIPASIGGKQPARLATDEFVIPADVVSHLGNGSSDAGAKVLYDMMNRVRKARTGNPKQGKKISPQKFMPR